MDEKSKVILHGNWSSPYSKRVEIALKLKGISYEYVEEDLKNKSESLIQLNPVHKKVPVLVHDGKPLAESLVILEYIDGTWKNSPRLFPEDPYERAKVRFWVSYINEQVFEVIGRVIFLAGGETQANSVEEARERIKVLEEGLKKHFPNKTIRVNDDVGLLEILIITTLGVHKAFHEATGVELIDPLNTPTLLNWIESLQDLTLIKQVQVSHDRMVNLVRIIRQKRLWQPANALRSRWSSDESSGFNVSEDNRLMVVTNV